MSKCAGQETQAAGGRRRGRRYTGAEAAIAHYLQLVAQLESAPALDMEIACNRPAGGSGEPRSEPAGLDDLMELRRIFGSIERVTPAHKWHVWTLGRVELLSHREAARAYNERLLAAGGARVDCISHTTARAWLVEVDAAVEVELVRAGRWRPNTGEDR